MNKPNKKAQAIHAAHACDEAGPCAQCPFAHSPAAEFGGKLLQLFADMGEDERQSTLAMIDQLLVPAAGQA